MVSVSVSVSTNSPQEKHRRIISNEIPIPFLSLYLHTKTPRIPRRITTPTLSSNRTKPHRHRTLFPLLTQEIRTSNITQISCSSPCPVRTSTFSVNDTFGDTFSIVMSDGIEEVEVLEEERTVCSGGLVGGGVLVRSTLSVGVAVTVWKGERERERGRKGQDRIGCQFGWQRKRRVCKRMNSISR